MSKRKTHAQFMSELELISPDIELCEQYYNKRTKVHCRCKVDHHEWYAFPSNLLAGRGCPKCNGGSFIGNKEFLKRLNDIHKGKIISLDEYKGNQVNIRFQCTVCDHTWTAMPHNVINHSQTGCPLCKASKGEKRIQKYLEDNLFEFDSQKSFDGLFGVGGGLLRYDFFVPKHNLLIEYHGIQHEKPIDFDGFGVEDSIERFNNLVEHDGRKVDFANRNNIDLLVVWYYDFDKIDEILADNLRQNLL